MITYTYVVRCPECEDEFFEFFEEAKKFALGCLTNKPIITQTEVSRNDFGECMDHHDLGTVWSWEDVMKETDDEPAKSIFTKDDLRKYIDDEDDEFNSIDNSVDFEIEEVSETPVIERKPVPEGMTIEQLVEEMEENEDEVECTLCQDLFDKAQCKKELNLGWLCDRCASGLISRGEDPVFHSNSYWDFLDEKLDLKFDFSNIIDSSDMEIYGVEPIGEDTYKAVLLKRFEKVPFNKPGSREEIEKVEREMFDLGGLFTFHFGKDGQPELGRWDPELLNSLGNCEIIFDDERYDQACERTFSRATSKTESLNEEVSFEDLVKDSINHLTNDLGKDPWAEDFTDDVISDLERNYESFVPEDFSKYQEWCSAVASEVSRQVNSNYKLDEGVEPKEVHDLGNEYDGGYPTEKPNLPEIDEVSDSHLTLCPECGKNTFDTETGICVNCGFN